MNDATQELYGRLGIESAGPRAVLHGDNTISEPLNHILTAEDAKFSTDVDRLFGQKPSYFILRKEKPQHRMILWMALQGNKPNEVAAALRLSVQTVRCVQKQPWFQDAFCKLSAEMGKDAMQTFLKSEAMPAILRVVDLAQTADSDAVRLAANKELLDRFLGKPVVKAEVKSTSTVDMTVADVTSLLAERAQLDQKLRANGITTGTN